MVSTAVELGQRCNSGILVSIGAIRRLLMLRVCFDRRARGRACFAAFPSRVILPVAVSQAFCFTAHKFRDMGGFPDIVMMEV